MSITPPSVLPAHLPRSFRTPRRRSCASIACTKPTGCLRFYGFSLRDLAAAAPSGMLNADIDPKLAWALEHREQFPVHVNCADRETLLRVPGLGTRAVDRIIAARRLGKLRLDDISRLSGALARARPFIVTLDWRPTALLDDAHSRRKLAPQPVQLALLG